ncbi:hypothetical protein QQ045_017003 [Rhodiola kirilowii]
MLRSDQLLQATRPPSPNLEDGVDPRPNLLCPSLDPCASLKRARLTTAAALLMLRMFSQPLANQLVLVFG